MYIKHGDVENIWIATGKKAVYLKPSMANRHGLIAGATGTGKTVTLKVIAESFSEMGVPVFLADIKGDLTGMCVPGHENKHIRRSIDTMGLDYYHYDYQSYPVRFFDVYGEKGHPVRTTVDLMGPDLLARLLELNETQTGILHMIFKIADDKELPILDLKDLRLTTQWIGDNARDYKTEYGYISTQSLGAIQRQLLKLEQSGGDKFFGEPALDIEDWFAKAEDGRGMMNILECSKLFQSPLLYSTFMLWMLSELYDYLPEVGDPDKPKIAFFFDEAHLLFNDAPKALLEKVEQVIRLIRSKGVSVWFITQNPADIPESVLGQLGSRVQHALRAYTPNEQKGLRYAARSFRPNEDFDTERVLQELGTGEALVSVLDAKGIPTIVERANVLPPRSSMDIADDSVVRDVIRKSPLGAKYDEPIDRESAFEMLNRRKEEEAAEAEKAAKEAEAEKERIAKEKEEARKNSSSGTSGRRRQSALEKTVSTAANTIGRELGRQLVRSLLGTKRR